MPLLARLVSSSRNSCLLLHLSITSFSRGIVQPSKLLATLVANIARASLRFLATRGLAIAGLISFLKLFTRSIGCLSSSACRTSLVGLAIVAGFTIARDALPIRPLSNRLLALLIALSIDFLLFSNLVSYDSRLLASLLFLAGGVGIIEGYAFRVVSILIFSLLARPSARTLGNRRK